MSISEELTELVEELAFEFSQSAWEDALILGFRRDWSMGGVLANASGLQRRLLPDDFVRLEARAFTLRPSYRPGTSWRNPARVWIANNARAARDALWDGDYEKAKRLMKLGGITKSSLAEARREVKKEQKSDWSGKLIVRSREIDKRSDWKTCK